MHKVECQIIGLSASPSVGGGFALLLKEIDGNRRLPIQIGQYEAQAIASEIENIRPQRPLTHDLLKNVIINLGATLNEVIINELRDNVFYAKLIFEVSSLTNEVDARPSDAIAIAVRMNAPIFVAERVLEQAGFAPSRDLETSSLLEKILDDAIESQKTENVSKESKIAALQTLLREVLADEDYERAAKIRDEINKLKNDKEN
ncbi:MAG: bifunctional nuclease family protein [Ignavibacteriaceae bacterium]|nr:bifunctional nuclease family protein [Ignavibacteriaceae bacterium]